MVGGLHTLHTPRELNMSKEPHNERVQIVAPKSWVKMVDEWRKKQPENINRSEAIRIMAERAFHSSAA
jgi:hypothetical protein